ncbi:MAG: pseudouridine synthase [Caulobacteraceae bacterium]
MLERLQKVMSEFGVASRRKCEELILEGRVKVNGITVAELGAKVDKQKDIIELDGKVIKQSNEKIYILLNKPIGYITSVRDQFGRPTVLDLVQGVKERVYPVGRLDYDTEGLIILTNDGELTYRITHPKHNIDKTYRALLRGKTGKADVEAFMKGIAVEDYITSPARLELIKYINGDSLVNITIHEGKNRQVRKMCREIGHEVIKLKRISIGKITLGNLQKGTWRHLNDEEVRYLQYLGGISHDTDQKGSRL